VNNKALKCSLDLKEVNVIKTKPSGSESEKKIQLPFDFENEVKALNDKKKNADSLEKAKRESLEDKFKHAEEAAKMQKNVGQTTSPKPPQTAGLDQLGNLKIEKNDESKTKISYGPFGYMVKLFFDLVEFIKTQITKLIKPSS
jgi:hypothetical protein